MSSPRAGTTSPGNAAGQKASLAPTESISPNPLNPRQFFRDEEMDALRDSISKYGILVPLIVYKDKKHKSRLVLIDGERRLRCARDLGLQTVPVNFTIAPSRVQNVLMMFNIHGLREQWDPLTIAEAIDLLMKELDTRNSSQLSALTGFTLGAINRSKKILRLPAKMRHLLKKELKQPKTRQILTEDFFLESGDAISALRRHRPRLFASYGEPALWTRLVDRRRSGQITSIVDLRVISDLANPKKNDLGMLESEKLIEEILEDPKADLKKIHQRRLEHSKRAKDTLSVVRKANEALKRLALDRLTSVARAELSEELEALTLECRRILGEIRAT